MNKNLVKKEVIHDDLIINIPDSWEKWIIPNNEHINIGLAIGSNHDIHTHTFIELAYVVKGKAKHHMLGKDTVIGAGDYFIVDFSTKHAYDQIGEEPLQIINCIFMPEFVDNTLKGCKNFNVIMENYLIHRSDGTIYIDPSNRIFHDENGEIFDRLNNLAKEHSTKKIGYLEIMRCELINILISTVRIIQKKNDFLCDNIEQYITTYVNENYMNHVTLQDIADNLNFSTSYISRHFQKNYGISFKDYLQKVRIEQSCRLLANTKKKIIEIAGLVGYDDIKFFTALFKKNMNMTPREYRRIYRCDSSVTAR